MSTPTPSPRKKIVLCRGAFQGASGDVYGLTAEVANTGYRPYFERLEADIARGFPEIVHRLPFGSPFISRDAKREFGLMDLTVTGHIQFTHPWVVNTFREEFRRCKQRHSHVNHSVYLGTVPPYVNAMPRNLAMDLLMKCFMPFLDLPCSVIFDAFTAFPNDSHAAEFYQRIRRIKRASNQDVMIESLPRTTPEHAWSINERAFVTAGHLREIERQPGHFDRRLPSANSETWVWLHASDPHATEGRGGVNPTGDVWLKAMLARPGVVPVIDAPLIPLPKATHDDLIRLYGTNIEPTLGEPA